MGIENFLDFISQPNIKQMLNRVKENCLKRCFVYGHDIQSVYGIKGPVCICCGQSEEEIDLQSCNQRSAPE